MTTELASQTKAVAKIDPRQANLKDLFERSKGAIAQVVPKHLTADRILKVALAATGRNPKLLDCTQTSILQSVMQAAQLGLEPNGPLGYAYLVPFSNKYKEDGRDVWRQECQMIIGYRGLIDLARRSGQVDGIEARIVCERDKFRFAYGLNQVLEHEPSIEADPGRIVAVYAIARLKDSLPQFEVMSRAQVDAIKAKSKTGKDNYGPWVDHFDEMARKTVVKRIAKYLPLTAELAAAIEADDRTETELDAGAFAAIPVEISTEESPLITKLAEKAKGKPVAPAEQPKASTPDALLQYEADLATAETTTQVEAIGHRIMQEVPRDAPGRNNLDRLFIDASARTKGK